MENIDLQVNDDLSKSARKKKSGNNHEFDGYGREAFLYDDSILMMMKQPQSTENASKLKRSAFSFNQIDDETRDNTFKRKNKDTDGLTQHNSSRNFKKKNGQTKNHLTS